MNLIEIILKFTGIVIWPLTIFILFFLFRKQIVSILLRLKKAQFPGGFSIETYPGQIEEAKMLSQEVKKENLLKTKNYETQPLTEVNVRMINLGLLPSPSGLDLNYYMNQIEQDPTLALAGIRVELEIMLKNLAKRYKVKINIRDSFLIITKKLLKNNAITSRQAELINTLTNFCNSAIHGFSVSKSQAQNILDISSVLRDYYITWLSWGFPYKPWQSNN